MTPRRILVAVVLLLPLAPGYAQGCDGDGVRVQVLGSGAGDFTGGRAATSHLVWTGGKARVLVDLGPGSVLRLQESGADFNDIDVVLFTQLRVDHSGDLPALIKAMMEHDRTRPLAIFGPGGNPTTPSTVAFVRALFDGKRGAFRGLSETVSPLGAATFKLQPRDVRTAPAAVGAGRDVKDGAVEAQYQGTQLSARAVPIPSGDAPGLAWRIDAAGKRVAFAGDPAGDSGALEALAKDADLLVIHHDVPEGATAQRRRAHTPPSAIGRIAYRSDVKQLLLSHRTPATLGQEKSSIDAIKSKYAGLVRFANDLDCITP